MKVGLAARHAWEALFFAESTVSPFRPTYWQAIVDWFGPFLIVGGWAGLAGANYVFQREIKALATYDIEL
jgi:hypothetical protein